MIQRHRPAPSPLPAFALALILALAFCCLAPGPVGAQVYTLKPEVNLRSGPGWNHPVLARLEHNQTLRPLARRGDWLQVRAISGAQGYVYAELVSDTWIKVLKKERRLYLMKGDEVLAGYPIALCPFNPLGDKVRQGDGGTPEGRFYVCEALRSPGQAKYGARSLRISYPNLEDARRGLAAGIITREAYFRVVRAIKAGEIPPQDTDLGGSIRIHGGGAGRDWTLGCMGMADPDIAALYDRLPTGVRVEVYRDEEQFQRINAPGYLSRAILRAARAQLRDPALYTSAAAAGGKLDYPNGDIDPAMAVCTDIVIRALRGAGLDLQALLYEDVTIHPAAYAGRIDAADPDIDHRRTRNLQLYFSRRFLALPLPASPGGKDRFQPGDLVTMDTGIRNGTEYDHIGIVDDSKDEGGFPRVINIWTTGMRTSSMDLLGGAYPRVVGHFRAGHPFDYQ